MPQNKTWVYSVLSVLALAIYLFGIQRQVHVSGPPEGFPPHELDYPATFEGIPVASVEEIELLAQPIPPGTPVSVRSLSGSVHETVLTATHSRVYLLIALVSGLLYWGVAAFIFAPRTRSSAVRDFFWSTVLFGMIVMIGEVHFPRDPPLLDEILDISHISCLAVVPVIFLHLTLTFPRRNPLLDRIRWLVPTLALLAVAVILWQVIAFFRYFRDPHPEYAHALAAPRYVANAFVVGLALVSCGILYWNTLRLELTREAKQTKWLLWGILIGITPSVFLRRLPQVLGLPALTGAYLDPVFEVAIPIAFVSAVVRYQFLDIDIIIRRTLIYATMAIGLLAVYLGLGVMLGRRLEGAWADWEWPLLIVLGLAAGVVFNPLRKAIGRWVDRTFFKIQHGHSRWLLSLGRELEAISSQDELAQTLSRFLSDALAPRRHAVVLRHKKHVHVAGDVPADEARVWLETHGWTPRHPSATLAAPHSTSLPEVEDGEFPMAAGRVRIVMLQGITGDGECLGLILLGAKVTGRRYIEPDIELMRKAADMAGSALVRIGLLQAVTEEAVARRQLDELSRYKDDFLSRVAHDLRTPLASITWSAENLLDGVLGKLDGPQEDYIRSIKSSAGHLNLLVNNLLEITRLEQGAAQLNLGRVQIREILERAIESITPLAQEKRVELRLETDDDGAAVLAHKGKLMEVVVNLLDNAIRYSPRNSIVQLSAGPADHGQQVLEVRDRGPGIGQINGDSLFERFKQSDPSPHSGKHGFGLGLYIVKSYIEMMGGRVSAGNHPGGGAVFACYLPEFTGTQEVNQ